MDTSLNESRPAWPRVIGTIGIVLGVLIFLDQLDDLWTQSMWTEEDWGRFFSPDLAALTAAALRPTGWRLASTLIEMGLGVLLVVGSVGLHRRRRSGIALCRAWAWVAVAWALAEIGWAVWLLSRYAGDVRDASIGSWQVAVALGLGLALVLLLAFPLFLLAWFGRPAVQDEVASWVG